MKIINALLSCPSDVFSNFSNEINKAIDDVNFYIEKLIDTHITVKHYLSSSYSQVGKPAQDHLDDTLIIDSDVCLAFYYHRLGTATRNYKSGTDEEIHLMRNAGKHVSLFRIYDSKDDKESESDLDEYFKCVSSFSMYKTIIGREKIFTEVRTDILNYLASSFSVDVVQIADSFDALDFLKATISYESKKAEIIGLINEINEFTQRKNEFDRIAKKSLDGAKKNEAIQKLIDDRDYKKLAEVTGALKDFGKTPVSLSELFDDSSKEYLAKFSNENGIELQENFLSFHGETIYKSTLPFVSANPDIENSPIKEKIEKLEKLSDLLNNYYSWQNYLRKYNDLIFVPLAISNNTTTYQEAVNVKVHIKSSEYISSVILFPDEAEAIEMYAVGLDAFFNPFRRYAGCEEYGYPPFPAEVQTVFLDSMFTDYKATIDNWLRSMFDYEVERTNDEVVLTVRFSNISAEEKHCFPTYLILRNTVESIYYDISGSDLPRKHNGKIDFHR